MPLPKILLTIFSFTIILVCSSFSPSLSADYDLIIPSYDLIIPSIDSVLLNGYPTNNAGQTYGPNIGTETDDGVFPSPDLLLAENQFGVVGYVKTTDLIITPESIFSAIEMTKNAGPVEIPMYLHDGVTRIGTFVLSPP